MSDKETFKKIMNMEIHTLDETSMNNVSKMWRFIEDQAEQIDIYKEIIKRFCDNVNYYERELAGSWMEIRTDAEQALAKSEQIGETE